MNKERYKYTDIEALDGEFRALRATPTQVIMQAEQSLYNITESGYRVIIPSRKLTDGIININLNYTEGGYCELRNTIRIESGARAKITIHHHQLMAAESWLKIEMEDGSMLELVEIAETGGKLKTNISIDQHRNSNLQITVVDLDNRVVVRNLIATLVEPGAEISISGLYMTASTDHVDNYIKVVHAVPNCTSNQLFKGVMGRNSTAAFTGHILVERDAQKTAAYQQNHNILLDESARINTRPQLEIYADDVKCNHGATVGRLDPEAIYYMRQRGISLEAARRLQLSGFAEDAVRLESMAEVHSLIHQKIAKRLTQL